MKIISHMKNVFSKWNKLSLLKFVKYSSFIIGAVILIFVLILIFFSGPFIDTFLKDRITRAFTNAYPAYSIQLGDMHYNIWKNRLGCDSVKLKTNKFTCNIASFSVSGIGAMKILGQGNFTPNSLTTSTIDAQKIVLNFHQSQNALHFGSLHISVPDSEMTADSIKYFSVISDEQFFAKSQYRQTRFRFDISQIKIIGLDCLALLQGNVYKARNINLRDVFADIFVNMDKPYNKGSSNPQMPNEALSSIKEIVKVDSLKIINGRLNYYERFAVGANPGVVTFNKVNASVSGIANHITSPAIAIIHGEGLLMNSARIKLFMEIPLTPKDFSLRYSGSCGTMDVTKLNAFLEAGEHRRIKSGVLQSATFKINVNSGRASGTLRVLYKDLTLAILNKKTGSENGIFDRISSLIGRALFIRGTNMPDKKGLMKIGEIEYTHNPDESFTQFVWFALRSGIGNVVGF